jgi:general secretion pathway protein M
MAITINKREKYAILLAGAVLFVFVLTQLIIFPFLDKRRTLARQLTAQASTLQEMHLLKSEYEALRESADQAMRNLTQRRAGFTLFSFLDELAGRAGLKDRIAYMKPSTTVQENSPYKVSIVETKLQGVTMKQLTSYLYSIETSMNMVRVTKLSIAKTGQQAGFVDAVLLVETFETS